MNPTISQIQRQSKSKENANKLRELAIKNNYSSVRFLIAPDKLVSEEAVIEDVLSLFESISNNPLAFKEFYSTKNI